MSVNHASSASAAEAAGPRVPAPRALHRRMRRFALATAICAGWLAVGAGAVIYVGGLLVQGITVGLALVPRAIVWVALAAQDGADWWSIAGRAGGAVAAALATPEVVWWLIGLELVGVAALAGLQKMLRDETRGHGSEEGTK
jgi:hypothetical protein